MFYLFQIGINTVAARGERSDHLVFIKGKCVKDVVNKVNIHAEPEVLKKRF